MLILMVSSSAAKLAVNKACIENDKRAIERQTDNSEVLQESLEYA
jgi:hypothetical protein